MFEICELLISPFLSSFSGTISQIYICINFVLSEY